MRRQRRAIAVRRNVDAAAAVWLLDGLIDVGNARKRLDLYRRSLLDVAVRKSTIISPLLECLL